MGLALAAAWLPPKQKKNISVLHSGMPLRCSNMAQNRKVGLE